MKVFPGNFLEPGIRGVYQGKAFEVLFVPETGTFYKGGLLLNDRRDKAFVLVEGSHREELLAFPLVMDEAFMLEVFPDYLPQLK